MLQACNDGMDNLSQAKKTHFHIKLPFSFLLHLHFRVNLPFFFSLLILFVLFKLIVFFFHSTNMICLNHMFYKLEV